MRYGFLVSLGYIGRFSFCSSLDEIPVIGDDSSRHTFGATSVKFVAHLAVFERLIRSSQASKICTGQLLMIKFESQIRWAKIFAMIHESIIWALVAPLRRHLASLP